MYPGANHSGNAHDELSHESHLSLVLHNHHTVRSYILSHRDTMPSPNMPTDISVMSHSNSNVDSHEDLTTLGHALQDLENHPHWHMSRTERLCKYYEQSTLSYTDFFQHRESTELWRMEPNSRSRTSLPVWGRSWISEWITSKIDGLSWLAFWTPSPRSTLLSLVSLRSVSDAMVL